MRILKFAIPSAPGAFSVDMPEGANITHVNQQKNQGALWALCDPSVGTTVTRNFYAVDTGSEIPEGEVTPIGTVLYDSGEHPSHILEVDAPEYQIGAGRTGTEG